MTLHARAAILAPMYAPAPPPAAPPMAPFALTCPRCGSAAHAGAAPQRCARCGGAFTLRAGPALDPSVVPPTVDFRLPRIVVKSAGIVLLKRGVVGSEGVSEGTLDPVIGLAPLDESGVRFHDVLSIAVWRKIDLMRLIVALVIPAPLTLLFLVLAVTAHPGFALGAAPFAAIVAYMLYRAVGMKAHMVRVVGTTRAITIRFDSPMWRRRAFHDELLRRAGLSNAPIP